MPIPVTAMKLMSLAGVAVAGASALGVSYGLLGSQGDGGVGDLSSDIAPPSTVVVATTEVPSTTSTTAPVGQPYEVGDAGTVVIDDRDLALQLISVTPRDGWTSSSAQPVPTEIAVTFVRSERTLVLTARLTPEGVVASVEETVGGQPVGGAAPAPVAPSAPAAPSGSPAPVGDGGDDGGGSGGGGVAAPRPTLPPAPPTSPAPVPTAPTPTYDDEPHEGDDGHEQEDEHEHEDEHEDEVEGEESDD